MPLANMDIEASRKIRCIDDTPIAWIKDIRAEEDDVFF